ncbi:MAG: VOC family protein [Treponema sp.]|jgi:catechol 2,3-dioxygenase-like lactoylglutathione lyase family enzyme|nr:VOC family protein [Treponema sp.]
MTGPLLGTNLLCQVGLLVHDIEKSRRDWAEFLGVEPPEVQITGDVNEARTKYLGAPSEARSKLAFFHVGPNVDVELIEPDKNPASTWRRDLDANGEGFHHIAFVVKGMKEKIAACEAKGFKLLQTGEYTGGRYAYIDANEKLKLALELLEND